MIYLWLDENGELEHVQTYRIESTRAGVYWVDRKPDNVQLSKEDINTLILSANPKLILHRIYSELKAK